jgi:raffinose/stachyose/melibiose transport system substrate-binding protein
MALAGALALAAGCGGDGGDGGGSTATDGSGADNASSELNILVSSADASDKAFNDLNEAFMKANPDIKSTLTSVPNDTYDASKAAQMTAGEADVVVINYKGFGDTPEYAADSKTADTMLAEEGGYVDLTDQPFMSNFNSSLVESIKLGGRAYALPTGMSYGGVYYNKQIFADNGLEVPTTWAEMEQVIATLQAASVTPFGMGGKDIWPAGLIMLDMVSSLYPSAEDTEALAEGLWTNTVKLNEGKPLYILERTQAVFDATLKNFAGIAYDTVPASFANGDFAMLPDGTWNHGVIYDAVGDAFEVGFFAFPGSDDAADNGSIPGKVELMLGISSTSKHQDAAIAWLDFFSQPENYATFVTTAGWAPSQPDIATDEFFELIAPYTAEFRQIWEVFWIPNNNAGEAATYPFNYPALSPLGTDTAQQAADASQQAWEAAFK